jgi:hypothetical protein
LEQRTGNPIFVEFGELAPLARSQFCAYYLPLLVDRFVNLPQSPKRSPETQTELLLSNAYLGMLSEIRKNPYFHKFLRSQHPTAAGKANLAGVLADRIVTVAPLWNRYLEHPPDDRPPMYHNWLLRSALNLLTMLLFASYSTKKPGKGILPLIRGKLRWWAELWSSKYGEDAMGDAATGVAMIFSGIEDIKQGIHEVKHLLRGWFYCAHPDCEGTNDLRECSR